MRVGKYTIMYVYVGIETGVHSDNCYAGTYAWQKSEMRNVQLF